MRSSANFRIEEPYPQLSHMLFVMVLVERCWVEHASATPAATTTAAAATTTTASTASARIVFGFQWQLVKPKKDIRCQPPPAAYILLRRQDSGNKLDKSSASIDWQPRRSASGFSGPRRRPYDVPALPRTKVVWKRHAVRPFSVQRLLQVHVRSRAAWKTCFSVSR